MATPSEISVGLSHEVAITACKAGWEPADFTKLAQNEEGARQVLAFLRGHARIEIVTHVIDCAVAPFVPEGWMVAPANEQIASRFTGEIVWGPETTPVAFHLDAGQQGDGRVVGNELRKRLAGQRVLPANVLDYLLAHPQLIPESWKGQYLFFWGTVYRDAGGGLCVRDLYWDGDAWDWDCFWLVDDFDSSNPAAVPAS